MNRNDYAALAAGFYTVGKDFAFEWMSTNANATFDELVDALLSSGSAKQLPSGIARTTSEMIANRVFLQTGRLNESNAPEKA